MQVSGWDGVPAAGDLITVVESEVVARQAAEARRKLARERTGGDMHTSRGTIPMLFGVIERMGPSGCPSIGHRMGYKGISPYMCPCGRS